MTSTYLSVPEVVERYAGVWSRWTIYEAVRRGEIPHRKLPGRRGLLFSLEDLEAFENGAELEVVKLPRGGRICRPREPQTTVSNPDDRGVPSHERRAAPKQRANPKGGRLA